MDQTKKVKIKKKKHKKRSSSKIYARFHEIRCESTILRVSGLDLHSSSREPVNFLGHSPRLVGTTFDWGAQAVIWGGTAPECGPVAPGLMHFFHITATSSEHLARFCSKCKNKLRTATSSTSSEQHQHEKNLL